VEYRRFDNRAAAIERRWDKHRICRLRLEEKEERSFPPLTLKSATISERRGKRMFTLANHKNGSTGGEEDLEGGGGTPPLGAEGPNRDE